MTSSPDQILDDFAAIHPQTLWEEMETARKDGNWNALARAAFALRSYVDKGGKPPVMGNSARWPLAQQIELTRLACEVALEWAARGGAQ